MKYVASLLVLPIAMMAPLAVHAQSTSNFSRDRNIAVTERIPTEYQPKGLRLGAFDVSPEISAELNANDNIYYTGDNEVSDVSLTIAPSVTFKSNWGRHEMSGLLSTTVESYAQETEENTTSWQAALAGRLDIHGANNLFGGVNVSKAYEARYNPSTPQALAEPVQYDALVLNAGFVAEGNRLRFIGQVTSTELDYKDARNLSGAVIEQDTRDYTRTEFSGRAEYAYSPATSFYAVYTGNKRDYRLSTASSRDSDGYDIALGTSFDLTALIRGEVQLGYLQQNYKNYKDFSGPSITARVQYFPTQLLTITGTTATSVEETPLLSASGYVSNASSLTADYELLRTLVISGSVGFTSDDYKGGADRHDDRKFASLSAKYLVSRNIVIRAGYWYTADDSSGVDGIPSYTDNIFKLSLGLQY